ncbi:MAG: methionine ABC transporter permease [Candidatus Paracaedibacteraceae bacterium]|nr:methionine ABC transporter permease [Candidatus Paracaedibacteraceae bacterium]
MELINFVLLSVQEIFLGAKGGLLIHSLMETLLMVSASTVLGIVVGLPLGMLLYSSSPKGLKPDPILYSSLSLVINSARSIPYIILTVLLLPLTRICIGTSIGTIAAIFPLTLASILLIARVAEEAFLNLPRTFTEIGISMRAKPMRIFMVILLPEALPGLIIQLTTIIINLVGFSAMAGTVGGGGLGDLAIRYGYQRYDTSLVIAIVFVLILLVQIIQSSGNEIARRMRK